MKKYFVSWLLKENERDIVGNALITIKCFFDIGQIATFIEKENNLPSTPCIIFFKKLEEGECWN